MASDGAMMLPTQRPLTGPELERILAPLGKVTSHRILSGGTFGAVQSADLADGTTVVMKTSVPDATPPERARLLTYERAMLGTERDMLALLASVEGVPSPRLILSDFTREVADVDVVVMEHVKGTPWDTAAERMTPEANAHAWEQVGSIMAAMQAIEGEVFGYPANGFALGAQSWPAFFGMLIDTALADAEQWGVDVEPDRVIDALAASAHALAAVTRPALVHNDLWPGNVMLDPETGRIHGVLDFERALFGDPLQDFCGAQSMSTGRVEAPLLVGYDRSGGSVPRGEGGTPTGLDELADARLTLYRLWSTTVQLIEIVPRGFHGEWVKGHRATINASRATLFDQMGV